MVKDGCKGRGIRSYIFDYVKKKINNQLKQD